MMLDGHIHIYEEKGDRADFARRLHAVGMDGGVVISLAPACFPWVGRIRSNAERLENVLAWCRAGKNLYPFYWIDPLEKDALKQVARAVRRGVRGFKVICSRHAPGHPRALPVYRAIAAAGRPILFHSGILWDGQPSSMHNRPVEFEPLLEIAELRFALAHVSWPWCDECLAVYGKFLNAWQRRGGRCAEMFIDLTPGTPPIYREEVLRKLFTIGNIAPHHIVFGSDASTNGYDAKHVRAWVRRDRAVYRRLKLPRPTLANVFGGSLLRLLGDARS
jgi:predicted TIM-barrel fold metal-dependent hydrolase